MSELALNTKKLGLGMLLGIVFLMLLFIATTDVSATAPVLTDEGVTPGMGVGGSTFRFNVTYTDEGPPTAVWLNITAPASEKFNYPMARDVGAGELGDGNYTNGENYYVELTLPHGAYSHFFSAQDQSELLWNYTSANNTPTVSNAAPVLSGNTVTPSTDTGGSAFNFWVLYTDADDDNSSDGYLSVEITGPLSDNGTMVVDSDHANAAYHDGDFTNGEAYEYSINLPEGAYSYRIWADDGWGGRNNTPASAEPTVTNNPPVLTEEAVSPAPWIAGEAFNFTVNYTDADNEAPASIELNLTGSGGGAYALYAVEWWDTNYANGKLYCYELTLPKDVYSFEFWAFDGDNWGQTVAVNAPSVSHDEPWLTPSPPPNIADGSTADTFYFNVTYWDNGNEMPTGAIQVNITGVITGVTTYTMVEVDPLDIDATDGKEYNLTIPLPGDDYTYHIACQDSKYWNETAESATFSVTNVPPTLTSEGVNVTLDGITYDVNQKFNFTITYSDTENLTPSYIRIVIIGVNTYDMLHDAAAGDGNWTNGEIYYYEDLIPTGSWRYYFEADDGTNDTRYPSSGAIGFVNVTQAEPRLTDNGVTPTPSFREDHYIYNVTYWDAGNEPPVYVNVIIDDGTPINMTMTPLDAGDNNYRDGRVYIWDQSPLNPGSHRYYFECFDGTDYNDTALVYNPMVSYKPTLTNGMVTPIQATSVTVFVYEVVYTDFDNVAPEVMNLTIDGTTTVPMTWVSGDYDTGATYQYTKNGLSQGAHTFRFEFADAYETVTTTVFNGPLVEVYKPDLRNNMGVEQDPITLDKFERGNVTTYSIWIKNVGTVSDTFTFTAGGDYASFVTQLPAPVTLIVNEERYVDITISVPLVEDTGFKEFNVTAESQNNPDADIVCKDTLNFRVEIIYEHRATVTHQGTNDTSTEPYTVVEYDFKVWNDATTADGTDFFLFDVTGLHADWAEVLFEGATFSERKLIDYGQDKDFTLRVTVPAGEAPDTFVLTLQVTIEDHEYRTYSLQFTTEIIAIYGVELLPPPGGNLAHDTNSGDALEIPFRINNSGNEMDDFDWEITIDNTDGPIVPADWTPTFSPDPTDFPAATLTNGNLTVNIPPTTPQGPYIISLTVWRVADTDAKTMLTFNVTILRTSGVDLTYANATAPVTFIQGEPGEELNYTFLVNNTGNEEDTFQLAVKSQPLGWTVEIETSEVALGVWNTTLVRVNITLPIGASFGNHTIYLEATSKNDTDVKDMFSFDVKALRIWGVSLTPTVSGLSTTPGFHVNFTINITNTGNDDDNFTLIPTAPDDMTLTVWVKHTGPINITRGQTVNVTVEVFAQWNASGHYSIPFKVESQTGVSISASYNFILDVYPLVVTVTPGPTTPTMPNSTVQFITVIQNTNNNPYKFIMTSYTGTGDVTVDSISPTTLYLEGGESANVTVTVKVGTTAVHQEYDVWIIATSTVSSLVSDNKSTVISVGQVFNFTMTGAAITPAAKVPGETLIYSVDVKNAGNGLDTFTFVITWDGITLPVTANGQANIEAGFVQTVNVQFKAPETSPYFLTGVPHTVNITAVSSSGSPTIKLGQIVNLDAKSVFQVPPSGTIMGPYLPDDTFTLNVSVKNVGNDMDDYTVEIVSTEDITHASSVAVTGIGVSATGTATLSLIVGPNALAANQNFLVRVTSSGDTDVYKEINYIATIGVKHDLLIINPQPISGLPGQQVEFEVNLNNTGNYDDAYTATITLDSIGFPADPPVEFSIAQGAEETVIVYFTIPADALKGDRTLDVTFTANDGITKFYSGPQIVTVEQSYGAGLNVPMAIPSAEPGVQSTYTITITNTGNAADTYDIEVTGFGGLVLFPTPTLETVNGQTSKQVEVTITFPTTAAAELAAGDYSITTTVTSQGDPAETSQLISDAHLDPSYGLDLTLSGSESVLPGQAMSFLVYMDNMGNTEDTITFQVLWDGLLLSGVGSTSSTVPAFAVNGQNNVTFTIPTEPTQTVKGTHIVMITAYSSYASVSVTKTVNFEIGEIYDLDADVGNAAGNPGERVPVSVTVYNKGSTVDSMNITVYAFGATLNRTTLTLGSTNSTDLLIYITIPQKGAANYTLTIEIASLKSPQVLSIDRTLEVLQYRSLRVVDLGSDKSSYDPDERVIYDLRLYNDGNGLDSISLGMKWPGLTDVMLINSQDLTPYSNSLVTIPFYVPEGAFSGDNIVEFWIKSNDVKTVIDTIQVIVDVNQTYEVQLDEVVGYQSGIPGDSVEYQVVFSNTGNGNDLVTVSLESPDLGGANGLIGTFSYYSLTPGMQETVEISFVIPADALFKDYNLMLVLDSSKNGVSVQRQVTLAVGQVPAMQILSGGTSYITGIEPGNFVPAIVRVHNSGNTIITGLDVSVSWDGTSLSRSDIFVTNDRIEPGETNDVSISIRTPLKGSMVVAGTHNITIDVGNNDFGLLGNYSAKVVMEAVYGFEVQAAQTSITTPSGRATEYTIYIENIGNTEDVFAFDVSGEKSHWADESTLEALVLSPRLESCNFQTGMVRPNCAIVKYDINVPDDNIDAVAGNYTFHTTITSLGMDRNDPDHLKLLYLDLNVEEYFSLTVEPLDSVALFDPAVQTQTDFVIRVTNTGNSRVRPVLRTLASTPFDMTFSVPPSLAPGEYRDITATAKPTTAVTSENSRSIKITADVGTIGVASTSVTVTVVGPDITITSVTTSKNRAEAGETVTIFATINNSGKGYAQDLKVNFKLNEQIIGGSQQISVAPGSREVVQIQWQALEGSYKITVETHLNAKAVDTYVEGTPIIGEEAGFVNILTSSKGTLGLGVGVLLGFLVGLFILALIVVRRRAYMAELRDERERYEEFWAKQDEKALKPTRPEDLYTDEEMAEQELLEEGDEGAERSVTEDAGDDVVRIARVQCPKCNKVTEVTTPQRPLQIPCDCGTILMLRK